MSNSSLLLLESSQLALVIRGATSRGSTVRKLSAIILEIEELEAILQNVYIGIFPFLHVT